MVLGLNPGPCACRVGTLVVSHTAQLQGITFNHTALSQSRGKMQVPAGLPTAFVS